jgi:hypothetical protein
MLQTFLGAGMGLDYVYHLGEDDYPGDYKMNCVDVWSSAVVSGSSEEAEELLRENVKPGLARDEEEGKVRFPCRAISLTATGKCVY